MENRYLFKAKRVDNGEWVQGYIVKYGYTGQERMNEQGYLKSVQKIGITTTIITFVIIVIAIIVAIL